ncbi:MAG: choline dehydrogenase [Actinomycetota bacterium]|jgi:choline dehydrogenase|nr:choline dehydrogenase [Actinomycetota bacterium]
MADYDFIVVGTGSAGSCLASRLSESSDVTVLALEAGPLERPEVVHDAQRWPSVQGTSVDWGYTSTPQTALDGRSTKEPRGKTIGGSSNLYIMMHIRGHPADYDAWAYNGCPGWSYEECLPWFQKQENQDDDTNPTAGHGGPIPVRNAGRHSPNPVSTAFRDACLSLGYPETADFNGPTTEGVGWHHVNVVDDAKRFSTAEGYMEPALGRPNLTLATGAQATRLLFSGNRCTGVEYVQDGETKTASATNEVVVCGGAIESPHLLLLSGIGPAAQLGQFGIDVLVDLPGVGENFHNHVLAPLVAIPSQPVPPGHNNTSEAALFYKSSAGWPVPDIQMAFVHITPGMETGLTMLPGVVRPLSRGWIRLGTADPLAPPLINPNYLGAKADMDRLVEAIKVAREIYATKPLADWVAALVFPGPELQSDDELRGFCRMAADSYHHQVGSCRMGQDELAVVDPWLRVYGVEGLRVADASVMPAVPSGNCHAGIVMIAERLADELKKEHGIA